MMSNAVPDAHPAGTRRPNGRTALLRFYWFIERLLVPGLRYAQFAYEDVLTAHVPAGVKWLDVGCGHSILPPWRAAQEERLIGRCRMVAGIDYSLPSLRQHKTVSSLVNGDVKNLPFAANAFGLLTANMVVEHLRDPEEQFREIHRVLEPGGVFVFHTPNKRGYTTRISRLIPERLKSKIIRVLESRPEEDVFPTYYRANTRASIEQLARSTGFEVVDMTLTVSCANFAMCPPLAAVELIWIRMLRTRALAGLRTNIITVLRKPAADRGSQRAQAEAVGRSLRSGSGQ